MTAADYTARCTAAGLQVLAVDVAGRVVTVRVRPLPVTVETMVKRLNKRGIVGVTFGHGDGTGDVLVSFVAEEA